MNDLQNIKRMLLPALRSAYIILAVFILAVALTSRIIIYKVPKYESTARLKLDDIQSGFSSSNLYKDFDVFSTKKELATEVEMLRSKELIKQVVAKLDFGISYYRVGKIRSSEMYHETPFLIKEVINHENIYDREFFLNIDQNEKIRLSWADRNGEHILYGILGDTLVSDNFTIQIARNIKLFIHKEKVDLAGNYQFRVHSKDEQINLIRKGLDVTSVDDDIKIVRISSAQEVPEKAQLIVNTLAETYIEDFVATKRMAATRTLEFIDERLSQVSLELRQAESSLEQYKLNNRVINTRQETETSLRENSQIRIQLNNLEMTAAALDSLDQIINKTSNVLDINPQVGFGDLLFTEQFKKLEAYKSERKDLLLLYTSGNEKVTVIDRKITELVGYIKESVKNARRDIEIKKAKIEQAYKVSYKEYDNIASRERRLINLERDFRLKQDLFNFLTEKKMEASIAKASTISFNRIVDYGSLAKEPISPKKKLLMIVSGMLGLIGGLIFVYGKEYISARVRGRYDVERMSSFPIVGMLNNFGKRATEKEISIAFSKLVTGLSVRQDFNTSKVFMVASTLKKEGKTFIASNLAREYAHLGWKVALVDLNLYNPDRNLNSNSRFQDILNTDFPETEIQSAHDGQKPFIISTEGLTDQDSGILASKQMPAFFNRLREHFEIVIIDTPASAITVDAIGLMKYVDQVFYVVRAGFTRKSYVLYPDMIKEEYGIEHMGIILNSSHRATNYNGIYTGSNYSYKHMDSGFFNRIIRYVKVYGKR